MALKIGDFVDFVPAAPAHLPVPQRWFLLRVNPSKLTKVQRLFDLHGISRYVPMLTETMVRRGRKVEIRQPLFVGIVFVPDFEIWRQWRDLDGVIDLLRFGDWTASLSPKLMDDVRALEASAGIPAAKLERVFQLGGLVRIVDGPFSGFQGRIDRLDSRGRIRILVDALKRGQLVEMANSQIEAVSPDVGVRRMSRRSRFPAQRNAVAAKLGKRNPS